MILSLDVYKRQDGYFQQYGTYARMSDEPDFQYLGGGAVTFKPVSYTHLDVYKRQHLSWKQKMV